MRVIDSALTVQGTSTIDSGVPQMNEAALAALSVVIFGWAILSDWFARHNLSGPLVFMVAGLVLANSSWGIGSIDIEGSMVHALAEITLALLLFGDASGVPPAAARHDLSLTSRLLAIGLPLSIIAGTAMAVLVFPSLPLALAGLIAASLAPTDTALSASVIVDQRLPVRVRRVLNVESRSALVPRGDRFVAHDRSYPGIRQL